VDSSERLDLEDFVNRVERLVRTRFVQRSARAAITIEFDVKKGGRMLAEQPDEEEFSAFLGVLRPLISRGERLFIGRIHNILQRRLVDPELKRGLATTYKTWGDAQRASGGVKLVFDGKEWRPDYVADLLINGHYFHDDAHKEAELAKLGRPEQMFVRHEFLAFASAAGSAVVIVRNVIVAARERSLLA
jgi:hypothetical protein